MYQTLLQEHLDDKRGYGESPQPGCDAQQLERLRERARKELRTEFPEAYYDFLRQTNGLDSNGLVVYASETTPIVGHNDMSIEGIVDANLGWRDFAPHRRLVVFAESGTALYVYDNDGREYQQLDRQSNSVIAELPSFEALLHRALEENRP